MIIFALPSATGKRHWFHNQKTDLGFECVAAFGFGVFHFMETKICNICKEEKEYTLFTNCKTGKYGKSRTCKECKRIKQIEWRKLNQDLTKEYNEKNRWRHRARWKKYYYNRSEERKELDRDIARQKALKYAHERRKKDRAKSNTIKGVFNAYVKAARKRGYVFYLPISMFKFYWKKHCYYCGEEMKKVGFDRKNNSIGYLISNIVPCCGQCNRMKMVLDGDTFLSHCIKVAKHHSIPLPNESIY